MRVKVYFDGTQYRLLTEEMQDDDMYMPPHWKFVGYANLTLYDESGNEKEPEA